jgi:aromatic ring-opening dioxygenase catalytic subunit (LigB family)
MGCIASSVNLLCSTSLHFLSKNNFKVSYITKAGTCRGSYTLMLARGSTVHHIQRVEAAQVSISKWMNKCDIHIQEILLSLKREENSDQWDNMVEHWWFHAKLNKASTKWLKSYDYALMRHLELSK